MKGYSSSPWSDDPSWSDQVPWSDDPPWSDDAPWSDEVPWSDQVPWSDEDRMTREGSAEESMDLRLDEIHHMGKILDMPVEVQVIGVDG